MAASPLPTCPNQLRENILEHRETYRQKFLQIENGPLSPEGVAQLRFFEPDSSYRVRAHFLPTPNQEPFDMPTYNGITRPYVKYGELHFELQGQACTLAVYQNLQLRQNPLYRDYLFLLFKDYSNGEESYGGGRYLDLRLGEIDEETQTYLLDFNRCYNPYCAYSDGYNCPIPPPKTTCPFPCWPGSWGLRWRKMLVDIHGVCPIVGLGPDIVGQGMPCPYIGAPWVFRDSETIGFDKFRRFSICTHTPRGAKHPCVRGPKKREIAPSQHPSHPARFLACARNDNALVGNKKAALRPSFYV